LLYGLKFRKKLIWEPNLGRSKASPLGPFALLANESSSRYYQPDTKVSGFLFYEKAMLASALKKTKKRAQSDRGFLCKANPKSFTEVSRKKEQSSFYKS
jgi:hypothetical protein